MIFFSQKIHGSRRLRICQDRKAYRAPATLVPMRRAMAVFTPKREPAMESAPKGVKDGSARKDPANTPPHTPPDKDTDGGGRPGGEGLYNTRKMPQPRMLKTPLFQVRSLLSSGKGRHTLMQAMPAHIARGRESSCMINIAEQTIQVRDKYHWLRADFKLNSRNRSGKLRR